MRIVSDGGDRMKKTFFSFNAWVHVVLFIISFSGIMLIYSSRYDRHLDLGSTDFALKQFFFLIIKPILPK